MKDQPARVTLISIPSKETVKVKNLFNVSDVCGGAGRVCGLGLLLRSSDVYCAVVHAFCYSASSCPGFIWRFGFPVGIMWLWYRSHLAARLARPRFRRGRKRPFCCRGNMTRNGFSRGARLLLLLP
jgi:hypothetical protein